MEQRTNGDNLFWSNQTVLKVIAGVAMGCTLWYNQNQKTDKILAKMDEILAIQHGVDDVQNLKIQTNTDDLKVLIIRFDQHLNQPFLKPEPPKIEGDDVPDNNHWDN